MNDKPVGLYGRSDTRNDGATLSTVQCKSGDSDCLFPDCKCPKGMLVAQKTEDALAYAQENASRNLSISIGQLEEMRWAVVGVNGLSKDQCLASFDDGVAKLKEALAAILAATA